MAYEIWSTAPGNLLATYDTRPEALAAVREALATHGTEYGRGLALAYENSRGDTRTIAVGEGLVALASATTRPARRRVGQGTPTTAIRVVTGAKLRAAERSPRRAAAETQQRPTMKQGPRAGSPRKRTSTKP